MTALTSALVGVGLRVARFEFEYMAARRIGSRKPPPRAELLKEEYCLAVAELKRSGPLILPASGAANARGAAPHGIEVTSFPVRRRRL